jgi:hypothetical protein
MRRLARTLGLALVVAACGHGSDATGPDVVPEGERAEHLAAMKNRLDEPSGVQTMRVTEVIGLPTVPRAYTRAQLADFSALEQRGVTVTGFVARLRRMDDGDFHVQITEAPAGRCLDSDTRDQLITELTPGVQQRKPAYTFESLRPLCGADTAVRVTGWLMYDSPHNGDSGRGTPWEVHPVTRIEVCCWRELT